MSRDNDASGICTVLSHQILVGYDEVDPPVVAKPVPLLSWDRYLRVNPEAHRKLVRKNVLTSSQHSTNYFVSFRQSSNGALSLHLSIETTWPLWSPEAWGEIFWMLLRQKLSLEGAHFEACRCRTDGPAESTAGRETLTLSVHLSRTVNEIQILS